MRVIDAHIHLADDHPQVVKLLETLELKLLNVAVAHDRSGAWRARAAAYRRASELHPQRYAWCTTFDPPNLQTEDSAEEMGRDAYIREIIPPLEADLLRGAIGCKVWKNIGMQIRKRSGEFLMIDDPIFDPLYAFLADADVPLLMHIGEPLACWLPLDDDNPHAEYYRTHSEWYMGSKPDHPTHGALMAARDRVLARHPRLKVIGAHLGSLEYDIAEIAERLDRYHNFAVDTSARLRDLARQDREQVRQFFLDYQDRILFGTDIVQRRPCGDLDAAAREARLESLQARWSREIAYYAEGEMVLPTGHRLQGLALPYEVVGKVLSGNAERWYPGV